MRSEQVHHILRYHSSHFKAIDLRELLQEKNAKSPPSERRWCLSTLHALAVESPPDRSILVEVDCDVEDSLDGVGQSRSLEELPGLVHPLQDARLLIGSAEFR